MAVLTLRRPRSGRLEGRTALLQLPSRVGLPQIPAGGVAGEEYVGLQKYRQHQRAAGRARDVPVALGAPYIVSGAYFAFVVDQAALEHKGLLDFDILVQCQLAPGLPAE